VKLILDFQVFDCENVWNTYGPILCQSRQRWSLHYSCVILNCNRLALEFSLDSPSPLRVFFSSEPMRCYQFPSMLVQNTVEVHIYVCIRVFQALLCFFLAVVFLYSCVLLWFMYVFYHTLEINANSKRNPSSPSVGFSVIQGNPDPIPLELSRFYCILMQCLKIYQSSPLRL
jgi:hypothetical protein